MSCVETDTLERIQVFFTFLEEVCRIGMGCFTSIFVSHMCGEKECSLHESIFPTDFIALLTILINLCSFLILFTLFLFELYRENWLITNFDKDTNKPETYLSSHIQNELCNELKVYNDRYFTVAVLTVFMFITNTFVNCVFLANRYRAFSTFTAFISFTVLLFQKVYYSMYIASRGRSSTNAHSAFMTLPHIFNVVDKDYKKTSRTMVVPI